MKKYHIPLLILIFTFLLSGCATLHAPFLEVRKDVIPVDTHKQHQFSVGTTVIDKTPGGIGIIVQVKPEDITDALAKNLANYDLLHKEETGKYHIDLHITFSVNGSYDTHVESIGTYLITNTETNATTALTINAQYTAKTTISAKSIIIGGIFGTGAGMAQAEQDVAKLDQEAKALAHKDKEALRRIGYAPDGVPTSAYDGTARLGRAYEGSIRMNIAHFIEKLASVTLPQ